MHPVPCYLCCCADGAVSRLSRPRPGLDCSAAPPVPAGAGPEPSRGHVSPRHCSCKRDHFGLLAGAGFASETRGAHFIFFLPSPSSKPRRDTQKLARGVNRRCLSFSSFSAKLPRAIPAEGCQAPPDPGAAAAAAPCRGFGPPRLLPSRCERVRVCGCGCGCVCARQGRRRRCARLSQPGSSRAALLAAGGGGGAPRAPGGSALLRGGRRGRRCPCRPGCPWRAASARRGERVPLLRVSPPDRYGPIRLFQGLGLRAAVVGGFFFFFLNYCFNFWFWFCGSLSNPHPPQPTLTSPPLSS